VEEYRDRIQVAYIRQVSGRESRIETIRELFKRVSGSHTHLEIVPDTQAAAEHAAKHGWIDREALEAIAAEVERDKADAQDEADIVVDRKDR
jgi:hypothetical protein